MSNTTLLSTPHPAAVVIFSSHLTPSHHTLHSHTLINMSDLKETGFKSGDIFAVRAAALT